MRSVLAVIFRCAAFATFTVLLAPSALAQPVTWEMLPLVPTLGNNQRVPALDFLYGEGPAAGDPDADSLVMFHQYSVFLYNPSGASGAAGTNGPWGPWHRLGEASASAGLVTTAGTLIVSEGALQPARGTGRGRDWLYSYDPRGFFPYFELEQAAPVGALITGTSDGGRTARSLADGAPGSWASAGTGLGYPQSFGEVPPSPALPNGRLLMGVWNGALYSDDGGLTYTPSNAFGQAAYIVWSFAFLPRAGHPYGGTAYAGVQNLAFGEFAGAETLRSDDGGAMWTLAHHFTAAEMEHPVPEGADVTEVVVLAAPDGALWAGVGHRAEIPNRGSVMRSLDGGATWERADTGFRDGTNRGYRVNQLRLSRAGVLHAATERGVWRTTTAVVAGEPLPGASPEVGVSVRPNPAGSHVEVVVSLAKEGPVRVVVLDALGREVAVVLDDEAPAGEQAVGVDVSSWPAGVYVVRVEVGGRVSSARLVVAR
jgi:hypothetical protein